MSRKYLIMGAFSMALLFGQPMTFISPAYAQEHAGHDDHAGEEEGAHEGKEKEQEKGAKGGKLFRSGDFAVEVKIVEDDAPPQFNVYAYQGDQPIDPSGVDLTIELTRIDGEVNTFSFTPENGVLVGNGIVTEPHSYDVKMQAIYNGQTHNWAYESYEGRTEISDMAAKEAGVKIEKVTSAMIGEYARLTGRITLDRNNTAQIRARFPGIVKSVKAEWGQKVKKGEVLATIESNESLNVYSIRAPIDGVMMARNTNVGDVAGDAPLFTVADLSEVWAEFHIFPSDLPKIERGQMVKVYTVSSIKGEAPHIVEAPVKMLLPTADAKSQTVLAIVSLDNSEGKWRPGMTIKGDLLIREKKASLAVKKASLQSFGDFTVAFAKFGETYEVRMLELGMSDGDMVEVLGGIKPNTEYVSGNSFLIKADVEKSGASHDH